MEMYNSKRQLVNLEGYEYLGEGKCARVFKKGNEVFKLYKFDTKYYYYLSKKMFRAIKRLDLPTIVKLYDYYLYYDDFVSRHTAMDAYDMEFIEEDETPVIDKSTDYLFSIANRFDQTVEALTESKILIRDPHYRNIIFGKDGATLIDVDTYEFCKFTPYEKLKKENQKAILDFLTSQLIHELRTDNLDDYLFVSRDLHYLMPDINKPLKEILEKIINESTPRKSMDKRKRLLYK